MVEPPSWIIKEHPRKINQRFLRYKKRKNTITVSILFFYVNVLQLFYDNFVYLLKQEHKIFTVNIYETEKINDNAIYTRNASVEHASGMRRFGWSLFHQPDLPAKLLDRHARFWYDLQYDRFYHPSIYDLQ